MYVEKKLFKQKDIFSFSTFSIFPRFQTWYAKTPLGKKRAKAAQGDEEDDKGKGKGQGKKGKKKK